MSPPQPREVWRFRGGGYPLKWGADETIASIDGLAADVVGTLVREDLRLGEDIERTRKHLANVPADRAWRRRGDLLLCGAHPDRLLLQSMPRKEKARRTRGHAAPTLAQAAPDKDMRAGFHS